MKDRIADALQREFIRKIEEGLLKINPAQPLTYSSKDHLKLLPQIPERKVWLEYAEAVLKEINNVGTN